MTKVPAGTAVARKNAKTYPTIYPRGNPPISGQLTQELPLDSKTGHKSNASAGKLIRRSAPQSARHPQVIDCDFQGRGATSSPFLL